MSASQAEFLKVHQQRLPLLRQRQSCPTRPDQNQGRVQTHRTKSLQRIASHHEDRPYHETNSVKSSSLLLHFSVPCPLTKFPLWHHRPTVSPPLAASSSKLGCTRWHKRSPARSKKRRIAPQLVLRSTARSPRVLWVAECGPVKTKSRHHQPMLHDQFHVIFAH